MQIRNVAIIAHVDQRLHPTGASRQLVVAVLDDHVSLLIPTSLLFEYDPS
jgi:hypothetical protein